MKLTDLEICKRIAEIEGYKTSVTDVKKGVWASIHKNDCYGWYNPLTDDALCFQLMVKYCIDVISPYLVNDESKWEAQMFVSGCADAVNAYDDDPRRAICLAIIEAHKND